MAQMFYEATAFNQDIGNGDADDDGILDSEDNCIVVANPNQLDTDNDGIGDLCDVCVDVANPDQQDTDNDGIPDSCDVCLHIPNPNQLDTDNDGIGDSCDCSSNLAGVYKLVVQRDNGPDVIFENEIITEVRPGYYKTTSIYRWALGSIAPDQGFNFYDACGTLTVPEQSLAQGYYSNKVYSYADGSVDQVTGDLVIKYIVEFNSGPVEVIATYYKDNDGDGINKDIDNCVDVANPNQLDTDNDGIGDLCDADADADGIESDSDNCIVVANPNQLDTDNDGIGDLCDVCVDVANPNQLDTDNDGIGDLCDTDIDNDGIENDSDNCVDVANPNQLDSDNDGIGDVCDTDIDNDGVENYQDNCVDNANANQLDADNNGIGDVCDDTITFKTNWSGNYTFTGPGSTEITVDFCNIDLDVLLYDATGSMVRFLGATSSCLEIGTTAQGLPDGDYYVVIEVSENDLLGFGLTEPVPVRVAYNTTHSGSGTFTNNSFTLGSPTGQTTIATVTKSGYNFTVTPM